MAREETEEESGLFPGVHPVREEDNRGEWDDAFAPRPSRKRRGREMPRKEPSTKWKAAKAKASPKITARGPRNSA
jgi:hypothetical protein